MNIEPELVKSALSALNGRSLVLVGMMGVGKSSIGKRVAATLELPFFDSDNEIEAAANMPITDIFETYGEDHFRSGEQRVIERLIEPPQKVLATGGGAFINDETRQLIKEKSCSIWLTAEFDLLMKRVRKRATRPLLKKPNPEQIMRDLLEVRSPIYAQANLQVESRNVPHEVVVCEVIDGIIAHFEKTK